MTEATYPCPHCNRYSCRCSEVTDQPSYAGDWTPWWTAPAGNA